MLEVVSTLTADEIIEREISSYIPLSESVRLDCLESRVLSNDIFAPENVPLFDRSTVDGYAVISSDTFGCTESMPCQLELIGEILMGEDNKSKIETGQCMRISTGGMLPKNSDSAVMVENTEEFFDGSCLVYKSVSPFENVTRTADDVKKGQLVLKKGTLLTSRHIGVLAALGISEAECFKRLKVGIISSGDEVVDVSASPQFGQVRDVNSHILSALCKENGCECVNYGIVKDSYEALLERVKKAVCECDIILLSGGSSAGERDMTVKVINSLGKVFIHGIAMKPGKPTIVGKINGKAVFGLPGHPAAAYFTAVRFVVPLVRKISLVNKPESKLKATTALNISSNHGREEFVPVKLQDGKAYPIFRKSGVISMLCEADGYIVIDRNKEGIKKDEEVTVILF